MNQQQRLFFVQARSDYHMFEALRKTDEPSCHALHYLQMATEKLAKAYFWKTRFPKKTHLAFSKFRRAIVNDDRVRNALGCKDDVWEARLKSISSLVDAVERLAPDLAGDNSNPEYPWPRDLPREAPVEFSFPLWDDLGKAKGREFLYLLGKLFACAEHSF